MAVEQLMFTVVEGGKGFKASAPTGYQIKSCSPGLRDDAATRERVADVCIHYGQTVYDPISPAVIEAREKESDWCAQQQTLPDTLAPQVLDHFPVVWSYTRVTRELWALTRTCYVGFCPDGKPGNFFAHALVFSPDELAGHDYNPLAASRSGLYRANDRSDSTELPTLADLGAPAEKKTDLGILRRGPWRSRLAAMLSALSHATPSQHPVLMCIEHWRQAGPLMEAFLALLPPSARCRTTICTFENDRHWAPSEGGARPVGVVAAHQMVALCGPDDDVWSLYPDDYHSKYAVFNFVGDRFSELPEPSAFARFATECFEQQRMDRLQQYHQLVERLGVGQDPDAWDRLLLVPALLDVQSSPQDLRRAIEVLPDVVHQPNQGNAAIELALPWLERLAANDDYENLGVFGSCLADLGERAGAVGRGRIVETVRPLAGEALATGRGRRLQALLGSLGAAADEELLTQLKSLLAQKDGSWTAAAEQADRDALSELLLRALRAADGKPDQSPPKPRLLVAAFQAAREADRSAQVWESLANTEIKAQLGGTWEAAQQRLARDLEAHLPASTCPEASAWLNMELVRVGKPEGEELTRRLVGVSAACAFLPENRQKTKQLLKVAKDRVPDQQARAVVLGRMAEATIGRSLGHVLYDEHLKAMEALKPNQRDEVRRQLARAGAARLLCRALLDDVLPWQEDSQKRFQKWSKTVLENQPRLVDCLCGRVVELLDREDLAPEALSIARQLMAKPPVSTANAAGILRLYNKVLLTLPLRPLTDRWGKIFSMLPEGLDAAAKDRLRMLKFMQEVRALAGQPDWSLAKFPHDKAAWRELHRLPAHEQWQAVAWCVDRLRNVGIEGPDDARVFVEKLGAAQYASLHQMARAVDRLSGDRDAVTQVLVATAFARCGVEAPPLLDRWNALVAAIANTLDAPTRRLFEAHLRGRFWPRDAQLDKRLHKLYVALGMEQPEPPPGADRPAKGRADQAEDSQQPLHRSVLRVLRDLFWSSPPSNRE